MKGFRNVRTKLISTFILLIVLPICIITIIQYSYSKQMIERQTMDYLEDIIQWSSIKLEDFVYEVEDISFSLVTNMQIQQLLGGMSDEESKFNKYLRTKTLKEQLSSYALLKEYINNISIYTRAGEKYTYSKNRNKIELSEEEVNRIYTAKGKTIWFVNRNNLEELLMAREVNTLVTGESLGYVVLSVKTSALDGVFSLLGEIQDGDILLIDKNEDILLGKNKELFKKYSVSGYPQEYYDEEIGNQTYSFYKSKATNNGWKIIVAVSNNYFKEEINQLRDIFYLVALVLGIIAIMIAIRLAQSITKPLVELSKQMRQFGKGDFSVRYTIQSNDEFGTLGDNFNQMVMKIEELLRVVYEQKYLKQKAELQSLQMQINPHFLYNTLETLNWMARLQGAYEIGEMVNALGNIMRFALVKEHYVTLEREVKSVEDYMRIQKIRYGERLNTSISVYDQWKGCEIPKLLIQPILENAIVYSVESKTSEARINIAIEEVEEILYIKIKDNGIGMEEKTIYEILYTENKIVGAKGNGIGIRNVNSRIKRHYGENYGVDIESKIDKGTQVTLSLPLKKNNNN